MSEGLIRIRNYASLLAPTGRGAARLLMERVTTAPRRVYVGAALAALLAGIGANALLLQIGRHPAPLLAEATGDPAPTVQPVAPHASPAPVAPHMSPAPVSSPSPPAADFVNTAPPAAPPAAGRPRATRTSASDTPSSLGPAEGPERGGPRAAAHAPDQIAALLRGKLTTNPVWCARPRSRWRSSDIRSSPLAPKTAPRGGLCESLSAHMG